MTEDATYVGAEEEYAPFWTPAPGDTITGRMVSVHVMQGDYGPTPVVTVENAEGRHAILVKGTIFREEMASRRPKPGDELTVTYLGTKVPKSGKGKPYHVYKVLGGTEPEFDWGAFTDPNRRAADGGERASAGAFGDAGFSGRATAEPPIQPAPVPADLGPLPPSSAPSTQEKAAQFGEAPPFFWEGPVLDIADVKTHASRW